MWADDEKKKDGAGVSQEVLLKYLGNAFPKCPQGGNYVIGPVGAKPTCSISEHSLR